MGIAQNQSFEMEPIGNKTIFFQRGFNVMLASSQKGQTLCARVLFPNIYSIVMKAPMGITPGEFMPH